MSIRFRLGMFCVLISAATIGPVADAKQAPAARDTAKVKAIRALLEITGEVKLSQQVMNQMMATMKQQDATLPEEFWNRMQKKFTASDLVELLIPVYDKYYTREDVEGLVTFYKTPLGRKVIGIQPKISREAITIGQTWGQKKVQEILEDMQKQHGPEKSSRRILAKPLAS